MAKYMVAPGKSLCTKAGIIDQYEPITAEMIGDEKTFKNLIDTKSIVANTDKPAPQQSVDLRSDGKESEDEDKNEKTEAGSKSVFGAKRKSGDLKE